jgi:parallel beta-helix repeat protein
MLCALGGAVAQGVAEPAGGAGAQPTSARIARGSGCTRYVSPSGRPRRSGRRPGSPTTLRSAARHARPGEVICLERGTYRTNTNIILGHSGRPFAPIVYRSYRARAVILYTGRSRSGGVLQTRGGSNWGGAHDIKIENLLIDGRDLIGGGIFVSRGSHHVTIRDCIIRDTGSSGISLNAADYVSAIHNEIYRAGYNQGWSSAISLWYGGPDRIYGGPTAWYDGRSGFHNIIVGNVISGTEDNSGHHTDGNGITVDGSGSIPPALISGNTVFENGGSGIVVYDNGGDIWVVNNTAYANALDQRESRYASEIVALDATNVHFVNNITVGGRRRLDRPSYLFNNTHSVISWSRNVGYSGKTIGVPLGVILNRLFYVYANPRFRRLPPIPRGGAPWRRAVPPWRVRGDFTVARSSPAKEAGAHPLSR